MPDVTASQKTGYWKKTVIESGITNHTEYTFSTRFNRDAAFRMEIDAVRNHGAGSYKLIYYNNGPLWNTYNSLDRTVSGQDPVSSNVSPASVCGGGIALAPDLIPDVPARLGIDNNLFSGFGYYSSAQVNTELLEGRPVYHLILDERLGSALCPIKFSMSVNDTTLAQIKCGEDKDIRELWVDADSYLILRGRRIAIRSYVDQTLSPPQKSTSVEIQNWKCSPKLNCLPANALIEFNPPLDCGRTRKPALSSSDER
jgi:hypothetical protein